MVLLRLEIPKKMRDVAQTPGIEKTPYDICFACPFKNETCAGGNECAVDMSRLVDLWNHEAKQHNITRADAADDSGTPLTTVNNIMTKRTLDPRFSTVAALSKTYNRRRATLPPCHIAALLMQDSLPEGESVDESETVKELRDEIRALKENERTVFDRAERQVQREVDHLTRLSNQQERRILIQEDRISNLWTALAISLVVCAALVVLVVCAIIVDYSNHEIGFFWVNGKSSFTGVIIAACAFMLLAINTIILIRSKKNRKSK